MASRGKKITNFLVEGEPDGLRTIELINWTGQAVVIPRKKIKDILKDTKKYSFLHLNKPGIYFLVGKNEEPGLPPVAYIGESGNLCKRLRIRHNENDKDYWQTTVAFVSKDDNLTKAHVKYLEEKCIEIAKSTDRYELQNEQTPTLPTLPASDQAVMEEYLDNIKLLLHSAGYPILQELPKLQEPAQKADEEIEPEPTSDLLFTCRGKTNEAEAEGYWSNEGFVVYKGSTANAQPKDTIRKLTEKLRDKKILTEHNGGKLCIFDEDYIFNSPSSASRVILGRSSNGWKEWKTEDGKTLDEIYRE